MQVRLDSAVGQAPPQDTFVSLRIGDVQRQSRFALARTFHFPEVVDERHGRLEVFKRIGQATVSFDTDGDTQDVEVACNDPSCDKLRFGLAVASSSPKVDTRGLKKARLDDAQRYVLQHRLEDLLSDAIREVIRQKPNNPLESLSEYFLQRAATGPLEPNDKSQQHPPQTPAKPQPPKGRPPYAMKRTGSLALPTAPMESKSCLIRRDGEVENSQAQVLQGCAVEAEEVLENEESGATHVPSDQSVGGRETCTGEHPGSYTCSQDPSRCLDTGGGSQLADLCAPSESHNCKPDLPPHRVHPGRVPTWFHQPSVGSWCATHRVLNSTALRGALSGDVDPQSQTVNDTGSGWYQFSDSNSCIDPALPIGKPWYYKKVRGSNGHVAGQLQHLLQDLDREKEQLQKEIEALTARGTPA
uniref:RIIa domain-containing protein n=1 Tax=Noctiluca scintillans TaxID=2966 RepID=A0A7S1FCZ2_NOCSC|mmetsp:Transcript_5112/g.14255  ORF Transcript_5112/g.14255 Transcript_5112/m.14255 type:complete len:414 (+) Transcript_5112:83-1324(+)